MNPTSLGERLIELRAMLPLDKTAPVAWSRSRLARAARLSPATVIRLETHGTGTGAGLMALLQFYQAYGFNSNWVIAPDNGSVPLYFSELGNVSFAQVEAYGALAELRAHLQPILAKLGVVTEMGEQELGKQLAHTHRQLHEILTRLLPPIQLATWVADLNYHQVLLPPVPAKASGWQQQSQQDPVFHFYTAGSSLPRCGNPICYLSYDTGPKNIAPSDRCPDCVAWPDETSPAQH